MLDLTSQRYSACLELAATILKAATEDLQAYSQTLPERRQDIADLASLFSAPEAFAACWGLEEVAVTGSRRAQWERWHQQALELLDAYDDHPSRRIGQLELTMGGAL